MAPVDFRPLRRRFMYDGMHLYKLKDVDNILGILISSGLVCLGHVHVVVQMWK